MRMCRSALQSTRVGRRLSNIGTCRFSTGIRGGRIEERRLRALVVHPRLPGAKEALLSWDASEAVSLARAAGWDTGAPWEDKGEAAASSSEEEDSDELSGDVDAIDDVGAYIARLERVDPRFFFHLKELCRVAVQVARHGADLLFVNASLSPVQQRHLEAAMDLAWRAQRRQQKHDMGTSDINQSRIAVFDRARVVLAIFARRASSTVARLGIELAEAQEVKAKLGAGMVSGVTSQLQQVAHALGRLPGCDKLALLPRSGGARGVTTSFTSSPQITRQKQQRAIDEKRSRLREEIARLQSARGSRRQQRSRDERQTIGLVGYTNVGKSAIVNRLTSSDLLVEDGVFVTLDVASRRCVLPSGRECYVLDSVGLIQGLPINVCEAVQATVQEMHEADVVLHVRDIAHPAREEQAELVREVLADAKIDMERVVEVWNKADLVMQKEVRHLHYLHQQKDPTPVYTVSALTGSGFPQFLEGLQKLMEDLAIKAVPGFQSSNAVQVPQSGWCTVRMPQDLSKNQASDLWAFLHSDSAADASVSTDEVTGEVRVTVRMSDSARARFLKRFGPGMLS
ncbi:hflX [Symbiodinium sp. CCMP2592]|nr:hflX [Symbiodinium sp. CCMP2592]